MWWDLQKTLPTNCWHYFVYLKVLDAINDINITSCHKCYKCYDVSHLPCYLLNIIDIIYDATLNPLVRCGGFPARSRLKESAANSQKATLPISTFSWQFADSEAQGRGYIMAQRPKVPFEYANLMSSNAFQWLEGVIVGCMKLEFSRISRPFMRSRSVEVNVRSVNIFHCVVDVATISFKNRILEP